MRQTFGSLPTRMAASAERGSVRLDSPSSTRTFRVIIRNHTIRTTDGDRGNRLVFYRKGFSHGCDMCPTPRSLGGGSPTQGKGHSVRPAPTRPAPTERTTPNPIEVAVPDWGEAATMVLYGRPLRTTQAWAELRSLHVVRPSDPCTRQYDPRTVNDGHGSTVLHLSACAACVLRA